MKKIFNNERHAPELYEHHRNGEKLEMGYQWCFRCQSQQTKNESGECSMCEQNKMNKYKTEYTIGITDIFGGVDVGVAVFDTYNLKEEAEADVKILESQYPKLRFSVEASEYLTN